MYIFIVLLPLLGSLIVAGLHFLKKPLQRHWIFIFTGGSVLTSFLLSLNAIYEVAFMKKVSVVVLKPWITTEVYDLHWSFLFDTLTCVMLLVVTGISTLVHVFSMEYMANDYNFQKFMSYLSLFTFFMLILVTADNLLQMFVGWEGVGLCSYLLINFWYGRIQANKAALKAMIINRIGDFGLAIAIFTIYYVFETLNYAVIFALVPSFADMTLPFFETNISLLDFIGFFLFVGAVGKSAQLGLHTWLPDAMEGPTPVSALIHAATMVTAGVFLICRFSPLIEYAPNISFLITIVGGMTAFFAATTGLLQNDLKRVIAYSTCSQLGYMVFAAGLSSYTVSVFHLSNHAAFKALLFLGAGTIIHAMGDEQDMRKMGGLLKMLPLTYTVMLIGSMALMGFPFLTGFYSKDVILEVAYGSFTVEGRFVHTLGCMAAFFTAYYSTRLIAMTFLRPANGNKVVYEHVHEVTLLMGIPLIVLSFTSIFLGYATRDMFIGLGSDFWGNALFTLPTNQYMIEAEWLDASVKMIPLIFSFSGVGLAMYQYVYNFDMLFKMKEFKLGRVLYTFLNRKWFFDKVYNEWVSQSLLKISYTQTYINIDRGILEMIGPFGISTQLYRFSKNVTEIPMSFVYHYIYIMLAFLILILFLFCGLILFSYSFDFSTYILLIVLIFINKK